MGAGNLFTFLPNIYLLSFCSFSPPEGEAEWELVISLPSFLTFTFFLSVPFALQRGTNEAEWELVISLPSFLTFTFFLSVLFALQQGDWRQSGSW